MLDLLLAILLAPVMLGLLLATARLDRWIAPSEPDLGIHDTMPNGAEWHAGAGASR